MLQHLPRAAMAAALVVSAATVAGAQQQQSGSGRGFDVATLDTTCAACTNFFQFANGGWLHSTQIPAAYPMWGTLQIVSDRNQQIVHDIVEEAAKNVGSAKAGSNAWKIGAFYASCMDTAAIDRVGTAPIQPELDVIARIRTRDDLTKALGVLEHTGGLAPYSVGAGPDPKSSNEILTTAGQGGMGLPNKDYYTRTDERTVALRTAYVEHLAKLLTLVGDAPDVAKGEAEKAFAIENRFAAAAKAPVELRDPNANYHKMTLAEFQALTPHYDWTRFFEQQGVKAKVENINVRQPDWYRAFDHMLDSVAVDDWKAYLRARAVRSMAGALPAPFANEAFSWTQRLTGQKEQLPRWKRCTQTTDGVLGEAVGQEYVKRTFTPEAKARALHIIDNLQAALRERIQGLEWMSDSTKAKALDKLAAYTRKIGYPDKWRDYSKLEIKPGGYAQNLFAAQRFGNAIAWDRLGKPVDKTLWGMTPPTVNAYYSPTYNEIVFPAGILQPPVFDPNADDAVNYGAMGAVIGHEMTHGFDDQGSQYDKEGNLKNWWTTTDREKYVQQTGRVVDQYNAYTVVDTATRVNGKLTLGENIADIGGLKIAYEAMQKDLAQKGRPGLIDGFTPEQRFFLGWAQVWRSATRPETSRMLVSVDVHSPNEWRVNGPLSDMPEFKAAWGCKEGDPMVRPAAQVPRIW